MYCGTLKSRVKKASKSRSWAHKTWNQIGFYVLLPTFQVLSAHKREFYRPLAKVQGQHSNRLNSDDKS